jgi:predicted Kef-type K+ transport protein
MLIGVSIDHFNRPLAYVVILIGYFIAGAGVGPIYPGFITILGNTPGIDMASALARAFMIAMIGVAIVPATIGFVSDATNLTIGMLIPISLLFGAGLLSRFGRSK